jgi:toxin ParE1/3/4
MAYSVDWSPRAIADVGTIAEYIARDSAVYASAVVSRILDTTRSLETFPFSGKITPEFNDETIREKLAYSYRIIYRIEDDTITIITVIHGKRIL